MQAVADAWLGEQVARAARVWLDLAAQLADEDAQIVRFILVMRPPDGAQQGAVRDDLAGVDRQIFEYLVFGGGQAHLVAIDGDAAALEVERQPAALELRIAACATTGLRGMAQRHAQPGDQFGHAKGLGQIIIRAQFQRGNLILIAGAHREDDNRY